jgi:SAM-dependent methyltransferase
MRGRIEVRWNRLPRGPMSMMKADATTTLVGSYFERAADTFDALYGGRMSTPMKWINRRFRSDIYARFDRTLTALAPLNGKTILDIGCGSGVYAVEFASRGATRVVGYDVAERMIELARRRAKSLGAGEVCSFVRGSFPDDAPNELFDHCVAMGVMDYIPTRQEFLKEMARRTRRSAIVSFPSYHWFRGPVRIVRYKVKRCPLWLYRESEVRELMMSAGFASVHVEKLKGAGMDFVAIGEMSRA